MGALPYPCPPRTKRGNSRNLSAESLTNRDIHDKIKEQQRGAPFSGQPRMRIK